MDPTFGTYFGKYKGFVRDNADPERRGRIRCYCPQVVPGTDDQNHWLGWAEPCYPWMGGLNTADFGTPPTKSQAGEEVGVWIEFEGGNTDFPIWVGTFVVAPTTSSPNAVLDQYDGAGGATGGSLIDNPPPGSTGVTPGDPAGINPPQPETGAKETRLMAKAGRDIVIGSQQGGYLVVGPSGVNLVGAMVRVNGRLIEASPDVVTG